MHEIACECVGRNVESRKLLGDRLLVRTAPRLVNAALTFKVCARVCVCMGESSRKWARVYTRVCAHVR
eukprot:6206838-Pleurochrysis_carterae.AAC.1